MCGSLNGLVVNAEWLAPPTNPSATPLPPTPDPGTWTPAPNSSRTAVIPFGPYGYTTAAGLRDLNPDSNTGSGVFWARVPPGRKAVVTKVKNLATKPAQLTIAVNGDSSSSPSLIAAGQTVDLRSPLPSDRSDISVRYTGTKTLVLLETSFE